MTMPPCSRRAAIAVLLSAAAQAPVRAAEAVTGAGATFPQPVYARWAADYRRAGGVDVRYAPVGSGAGLDAIANRSVDFGATDVPLPPGELQRRGLVQFPAVIGGVVPVVHIAGIASGALQLSGEVLAGIYLGRVRRWDDAAIAALNPGLALPGAYITVVHRADASGTSALWSAFLAAASPAWQAQVGTGPALAWPVGVADTGNEGVAASVQRTQVSIGYVEYAYARQQGLGYAAVRNRDGRWVLPGRAAFEAAVSTAHWHGTADLAQPLVDAPGAASWPITGASYVLLPRRPEAPARMIEVLKFFDWALRHGAAAAAELDYVPMPADAVALIGRVWADEMRTPDGRALWPPRP